MTGRVVGNTLSKHTMTFVNTSINQKLSAVGSMMQNSLLLVIVSSGKYYQRYKTLL